MGILRCVNGDEYKGNFCVCCDRDFLCWEYENNKDFAWKFSEGTKTLANGDVYDGKWSGCYDGKTDNSGFAKYDMCYYCHTSSIKFANGRVFTRGEPSESYRNGNCAWPPTFKSGIMVFPNGEIYEGEWKDGLLHGIGKLVTFNKRNRSYSVLPESKKNSLSCYYNDFDHLFFGDSVRTMNNYGDCYELIKDKAFIPETHSDAHKMKWDYIYTVRPDYDNPRIVNTKRILYGRFYKSIFMDDNEEAHQTAIQLYGSEKVESKIDDESDDKDIDKKRDSGSDNEEASESTAAKKLKVGGADEHQKILLDPNVKKGKCKCSCGDWPRSKTFASYQEWCIHKKEFSGKN